MKTLTLLTYSWTSTVLCGILVLWTATVPNLVTTGGGTNDELYKIILRLGLYSFFFLLFYRSIIVTLKSTVDRLSKWRSKKEEIEDSEFVLIIETLVVVITVLSTILLSIFEVYLKNFVQGRNAEVKDVLISTMAALLTGIVVYTFPSLGELEILIKHKFFKKN